MGTEVLRPHDLLAERFHGPPPTFYRRRNFPAPAENLRHQTNGNISSNRKTSPRPEKKKQFEAKRPQQQHRRKEEVSPPKIGKVTLLRRGESLDSLTNQKPKAAAVSPNRRQKPVDDLAVIGTGRIGPESPQMLPRQIRTGGGPVDMYAGAAAFSMSPSPRALPLPSFFSNKQVDDPASRDLRRLLRLEI